SESNGPLLDAMRHTANTLRIELQPIEVGELADLEGAFSRLADQQISALVVGDHAFFVANPSAITALATRYQFPSIGSLELASSGGLLAYGVDFAEQFRRAAVFVDKILKGEKPGALPIERSTKFITVVNIKTAKALGIEMPTSILLRADEVI